MSQVVYVGTIGCHVHILIPDDLVTDVESIVIEVCKPSLNVVEWNPLTVDYDSETEITTLTYETIEGDLNEAGMYRIQPVVTMTDGDVWPLGVAAWSVLARFEV